MLKNNNIDTRKPPERAAFLFCDCIQRASCEALGFLVFVPELFQDFLLVRDDAIEVRLHTSEGDGDEPIDGPADEGPLPVVPEDPADDLSLGTRVAFVAEDDGQDDGADDADAEKPLAEACQTAVDFQVLIVGGLLCIHFALLRQGYGIASATAEK